MIGFSGIFDALLLIALGIGYIVVYLAKREEKELRVAGYIIGGMIILLALLYTLSNLWIQAKVCSKIPYYKGMIQQQMIPPAMPKRPVQEPPSY